jgi:hypothetical protein
MNSSSEIVVIIAGWAVIGAIFTPIIFKRKGYTNMVGAFIGGALMGALGGPLILLPVWIFTRRKQAAPLDDIERRLLDLERKNAAPLAVPANSVCPRCLSPNRVGAKFCSRCGNLI